MTKRFGTVFQQAEPQQAGMLQKYITEKKMIDVLRKKGVKNLFPVQYRTFKPLFQGKDLMVRDKTGSGKTLAFALPIIQRLRAQRAFQKNHLAKFLIVLPTRELALQVKDQISSLRFTDEPDFRVVAVYGKACIQTQKETISRGIDIIVATPGRLIDLLQRGVVKMNEMQVLCLDEADEMLKQGFQEDIEKIYKYITDNAPKKTQNLLFSATIPQWLHNLSRTYQDHDREYINLLGESSHSTPPTLTHYSMYLSKEDEPFKPKVICNLLKKYAIKSGHSLIFCETKNQVSRMASSLKDLYNIDSECLHSDIPQSKRERAYRRYKSGDLKCIIATNVAARGLDFPEIDIVIQTQPPNATEPYIHRSGRTARKGRQGMCVTLFNDRNMRMIRNIEREAKIEMKELKKHDFLGKSDAGRKRERDRSEESDRDRNRESREKRERNRNTSDQENGHESRNHYKSKEQYRPRDTQREYEDFEIYAKYLPTDKSETDVKEFFLNRKVEIRSVKILRSQEGQSKGCAFLKFNSKGDRDDCLKLDGESFEDNTISLTLPNKR